MFPKLSWPFLTSALLLLSVTSSNHVMKRSDDINPLEAVVSRLSQEVSELKARMEAMERATARKVAFCAELPSINTLPVDAPIHFKLRQETGGGYDSATGIFTAPLSGWYSFDIQLSPKDQPASFHFDLLKNGVLVTRSGCSPQEPSCSAGSTLLVKAGDRFWVQTGLKTLYWSGPHSFFSAFLVIPEN
ncbi:collagen alpha-2(VIII) chain-like [Littorina saxatilis]|uniref:C1q domain-containing protein n=1 Tax=Littorina saxatilis TaxID=31220 RepID=A0AAN9FZD4_9CAEN